MLLEHSELIKALSNCILSLLDRPKMMTYMGELEAMEVEKVDAQNSTAEECRRDEGQHEEKKHVDLKEDVDAWIESLVEDDEDGRMFVD